MTERELKQSTNTASRLRESQDENQRLRQALERQKAEAEILRKVGEDLTASLDLQHVLRSILSAAMQLDETILDAHIFLYDSGKLNFGGALFKNEQESQPFSAVRPHGLTYTVARLARVVNVTDMSAHQLYKDTTWQGSIVGIPLKIGMRVVGVLTAYRNPPREFSEEDQRTLHLLAGPAAIAIENARLHNLVDQQAHLDPLTGLHNRRSLDDQLENEVHRYKEAGGITGQLGSQRPFSLLMMDLDGFDQINKRYGRQAGDHVIKEVSYSISQALRKTDFLARYGGDQMAAIITDTDRELTLTVAGRIQEYVSTSRFNLPDISQKAMTVSIGAALYPEHGATTAEIIEAADRALYIVKNRDPGGVGFAGAAE
jgi:diguanylate cyclase (GGDEF)-like protein